MPTPANSLNITQPGVVVFDGVSVFTGVTITGGTGITVTNGTGIGGNPTISLAAGGAAVEKLTGNSGIVATPDVSNNINVVGTGSITFVGTANTLTGQVTGLTNHSVLVGAGTATITKVGPTATSGQVLQSAGSSADPAFSTATYPATTTISQLLYSSAANVVSGLATANRAVVTTTSTGVPVVTALATDGQLIIGSTAGAPAAATLTAGTGTVITNASNSITIKSTPIWTLITDTTLGTQATITFTSGLTAYNRLLIIYGGITSSLTGVWRISGSIDGGSNYNVGGSSYIVYGAIAGELSNTTPINLSAGGGSATAATNGFVMLENSNTTMSKPYHGFLQDAGTGFSYQGIFNSGVQFNAIKIDRSAGNFTGGHCLIYGM